MAPAAIDMLGLYLHIPFCSAICSYCNFNRGLLDDALKTRYVAALEAEIRSASDDLAVRRLSSSAVDSVFFGGGTPSLLDPAEVARLIAACRDTFNVTADAEITLEANPETVTGERLDALRAAGVNRISFGVQSFDDTELRRLGRIHTADTADAVIRDARARGFDSLSFDLMLWLPEQTPESWRRTVDRAIALDPDHLSLYLLELYPNAPLKEAMARSGWSQTPDDDAAEMYLEGLARLDAAGYQQYEISNVARPGHRARHNLKYWQSGDWFGVGCGAHSTVAGERWRNLSATGEYIDRIGAGRPVSLDRHALTHQARVEEALFTGLRLSEGVDRRAFAARWGVDPWATHGDTLELRVEAGHVWRDPTRFGLTRAGMLVANDVLATLI